MDRCQKLYFIAVILDDEFCKIVDEIKLDFAENYHSKAALRSPPHITIFPPFYFDQNSEAYLKNNLNELLSNQESFKIQTRNFNCFSPRVIYIDLLKTKYLANLFEMCVEFFEGQLGRRNSKTENRQFSPHMTVAFKDLSKEMFYKAWEIYKRKEIYHEFICDSVYLLKHNGARWEAIHRVVFDRQNT